MKKKLTASAAFMMVMGMAISASAAFDEDLNNYTLDTVIVEGDATKNKFGDTITEQSYYRTGGDVKVITREELDKRHYVDATDAIKRIPGVTFSNPGYRGTEYGSGSYGNGISINGDSRVVILVDGKRVDNGASTRFGSSATGSKNMVDINEVISLDAVDKIEVIKGPGASVYGADATGGVINFITRKGGKANQGSIDLSTGSWKKHVYKLNYSGSAGKDESWHYFVSGTRQMSGDSKYKDGLTGNTYTYEGTNFKQESANVRIDKDFNDKQSLKISYNHTNEKDGYPITAPDYRYYNEAGWNQTFANINAGKYGDQKNPGYRNVFKIDALYGSYNAHRNNDFDVTYTFDKDNGMESFVRFYDQKHHYWGRDWYNWDDNPPFPGSAGWQAWFDTHHSPTGMGPNKMYTEHNRGVQVQHGKAVGVNDVLFSITVDNADRDEVNFKTGVTTRFERDSVTGYVQDKIHITDKWDLTPSIRYHKFKTKSNKTSSGVTTDYEDSTTLVTPSLNTQYMFDDTMSVYLGVTKINRPVKANDLMDSSTLNGAKLKDEKGMVYTFGINKEFGEKTNVAVHYDYTDMSNAVTSYRVYDPSYNGGSFRNRSVNAKESKKSFNITADHKFDDNWSLGLAYTHLKDNWSAKDGMTFDPLVDLTSNSNVNSMINHLRPQNHYTANLTFEKGKWYVGALANWYTGMNTNAFTCKRAFVMDLSVNYEATKQLSFYGTVNNLFNTAYENNYYSYNGKGARPQYGRAFMVGAKFKF